MHTGGGGGLEMEQFGLSNKRTITNIFDFTPLTNTFVSSLYILSKNNNNNASKT